MSSNPGDRSSRVLIVDDNRDAAITFAMLVRLSGAETRIAHDGASAVTAAEQFRPQLIFMDLGMPVMCGLEATRTIRQQPWGREILIAALTGWGEKADRVRSRSAGVDLHLLKPIGGVQLEALLNAAQQRI